MGTRGRPLRRFATALAVMGAAIAVPFIAAPPASAALPTVTFNDEDSVVLPSFPTTEVISLDQIDPAVVEQLTKVTITATVDGGLEGALTNLSETVAKTITAGAEVGITVTDAGIIEPLEAVASSSGVFVVPPGATVPVSLSNTDSDQLVLEAGDITPALEALLVGTGEIDFTVVSSVGTDVGGPAPYLSTGEANGTATVSIEYEYEPALPECVDITKIDNLPDPLVVGDTYVSDDGNVELTIDALHGDNSFDWSSNVPIFWMAVKGGSDQNGGGDQLFDDLGGATSGTAHAPDNSNNGSFFAASHITVCYEPGDEPPPEVCPNNDVTLEFKGTNATYDLPNGGTFETIADIAPLFDWESNAPVFSLRVNGPDDSSVLHEYDGAFSGDDVEPPEGVEFYEVISYELCVGDPVVDECPEMDGIQTDPADCEEVPPPRPPPPAECIDWDVKVDPVEEGDTDIPGGGVFTITKVDTEAKTFDWSSTRLISVIGVKGGPNDIPLEFFEYDPPALEGFGLHAPENPENGKWYGLSHLEICVGGPPPAEEVEIQAEGDDGPKPQEGDKAKDGDNGKDADKGKDGDNGKDSDKGKDGDNNGGNGGGGGNPGVNSSETQSTKPAPESQPAPSEPEPAPAPEPKPAPAPEPEPAPAPEPEPAPKPAPAPEPEPKPEPQVQEEETKPPPKDEQAKKNEEDESEDDEGDDTEKGAE